MNIKLRNVRPNLNVVEVGKLEIYFSYETPVAYFHPEDGYVVSENIWTPTTGKHLNEIPGGRDKSKRVAHAEFTAKLDTRAKSLAFDLESVR